MALVQVVARNPRFHNLRTAREGLRARSGERPVEFQDVFAPIVARVRRLRPNSQQAITVATGNFSTQSVMAAVLHGINRPHERQGIPLRAHGRKIGSGRVAFWMER